MMKTCFEINIKYSKSSIFLKHRNLALFYKVNYNYFFGLENLNKINKYYCNKSNSNITSK